MEKKEWNELITNHGNGYRIINLKLLREFKDVEAALMLVELVDMYQYLFAKKKIKDAYFFYVDEQMHNKLSIAKSKIPKIRKILIKKGFVEYEGKGQPYKFWYKINFHKIKDFLLVEEVSSVQPNDDTSLSKTKGQDNVLVEPYIENKRIENERIENERIENERIENIIKVDIEYIDPEIIEAYELLFDIYPKSLEKDICKEIFFKFSDVEHLIIVDRILSISNELKSINGKIVHIPTFKSFLLNEVWRKPVSEWYPWDK